MSAKEQNYARLRRYANANINMNKYGMWDWIFYTPKPSESLVDVDARYWAKHRISYKMQLKCFLCRHSYEGYSYWEFWFISLLILVYMKRCGDKENLSLFESFWTATIGLKELEQMRWAWPIILKWTKHIDSSLRYSLRHRQSKISLQGICTQL